MQSRLQHALLSLLATILVSAVTATPLVAATLGVLYPTTSPPYQDVFEQIIQGITAEHGDTLIRYPLAAELNQQVLFNRLQQDQVEMVISLGRSGLNMVPELRQHFPVVAGALPLTPALNVSGVSLIEEPASLFRQLQKLSPDTRRVITLFSPYNRWLIRRAMEAAQQFNLELLPIEVNNLTEAVTRYRQVLPRLNNQTDAIWLPVDRVSVNEQALLPLLLQTCWKLKLPVFSSRPSHVKRGILFSIYPNSKASGKRMTEMVRTLHTHQQQPGIELSNSNLVAVNLLTAEHLGYEFTPELKQSFYATVPVKRDQ
ncbi:ABC transporter substrate-binding protein [Pontibacter sp. JAM-7]|uniref:ABC transporter substrate-binding protein n=1 Tax=Pontibacter sp. JAM-7 TaxID=3366581 RepID=UPI003AF5C4A3